MKSYFIITEDNKYLKFSLSLSLSLSLSVVYFERIISKLYFSKSFLYLHSIK